MIHEECCAWGDFDAFAFGVILQTDAFASDSVRMINQLRGGNPDLQILLFSATFNDTVKGFAMKVVKDANQVKPRSMHSTKPHLLLEKLCLISQM